MGYHALTSNTIGGSNVGVGYGALDANIDGSSNVAVGKEALKANTAGNANVAVGREALYSTTTGSSNVGVGYSTLSSNTTGSFNIAAGRLSLAANTTGASNVAMGYGALASNTTANDNTGVGAEALDAVATGDNNTAVGTGALGGLTSGSDNIAIGWHAGILAGVNRNDNIYIGNVGNAESNTIRIGTNGTHDTTFIQGIYSPVISTRAVYVNSSGQLGTLSSSRRYKKDIRGIGTASSRLLKLRPVSYRYKHSVEPDSGVQYGLIAEEVASVFPELVERNAKGEPETVRYQFLGALLLQEVQNQHRTLEAQQVELRSVRAENAELRTRLKRVDALQAQLAVLQAERRTQNLAVAR